MKGVISLNMKRNFFILVLLVVPALILSACGQSTGVSGSGYPSKAITVVAPSGAGGGWDLTARVFTKVLGEAKLVNQPMMVENKPGGGGAVFLAEYVTGEPKNDYKLFVNSPPILINHLKAEGNSPYGYQDTTPLAQLTKDFGAYVVKADSSFQTLADLINALKSDPTKITVAGGSAPGSMDHLVAVLPAYKSGIDPKTIKYVSYDGGGEAMAALLGGNADMIVTDASSVGDYLKAGKVRVLAVTSKERLGGDLKEIPTLKELGIDADFTIWRGVFGPKEMSQEAYQFWQNTLKKMVDTPEWKKELDANHWASEYRNGEEFKSFLGEQEKLIQDMLSSMGMSK